MKLLVVLVSVQIATIVQIAGMCCPLDSVLTTLKPRKILQK